MEKKVNTNYAADLFVSNCGGTILWVEADGGDTVKCQEETDGKFSRVSTCTIRYNHKSEAYIIHKNRRIYMSNCYRRNW